MKLGIIMKPEESAFKFARDNDLSFIEICHNVGRPASDLNSDAIKGYIDKYGVAVGSVGRWGAQQIDEKGEIIEDELKTVFAMMDKTADMGCDVFVTGVNYVDAISPYDNLSSAIKYLQTVVDYGKSKGLKVCTNNCDWGGNFVRCPEIWKYTHGQIKDLGIKYDPSHCINEGDGRYREEMVEWGHRFYHVHIKGTINLHGDHIDDPPAGLDMINWGEFMGILYKLGYDGNLSIEPHSATWRGELGDKGVQYTINMMKQLIF